MTDIIKIYWQNVDALRFIGKNTITLTAQTAYSK